MQTDKTLKKTLVTVWQRGLFTGVMALAWALALVVLASVASAQTLKLESWRVDDTHIWQQHILPAFNNANPGVEVQFNPTKPTLYDAALRQRLERGTAGDLIACRPFDQSIELYEKNHLIDITSYMELRRFRSHSKIAWTTYYADRVFCMPVASVMTGFFYNAQIFEELNLVPPTTQEEMFELLQAIAQSGKYIPLAFGTQDAWQAAQVLLAGVGPNYWLGEQGRINVLLGRAKLSDPAYVEAWEAVAKLAQYLPPRHHLIDERAARDLFLSGKAAIYPAGSWEIPFLSDHPNAAQFGVFAPQAKRSQHNCYVLNHFDKGIGVNNNAKYPEQAEAFLRWLSTPEFARLQAKHMHGFFPLSNYNVRLSNPLAREMMSWRNDCDTTIRINSQYLNNAWPQLEEELWKTAARVLQLQMTAQEAAQHISQGVEKWFKPI